MPAAFVCHLSMCLCACFYVSVCRLTYLNWSISGQLKSPPTKWISLDVFICRAARWCLRADPVHRRLDWTMIPPGWFSSPISLNVVAGVSSLLRFSVPVCSLVLCLLRSSPIYWFVCVCARACLHVLWFQVNILESVNLRTLEIAPHKWICLDLLSFMTGIC